MPASEPPESMTLRPIATNWRGAAFPSSAPEVAEPAPFRSSLETVNPKDFRPLVLFCGALLLLGIIGWLDWMITSAVSVSLLYLLPVCLTTWFLGTGKGMSMAALAAVFWYVAEAWGRGAVRGDLAALWQGLSRFGFFTLTAYLLGQVRLLTFNLEFLVHSRTQALQAEVAKRKEMENQAAEISEREQERIADELHNELSAYMAGIGFRAKIIAESLEEGAAPEAVDAGNLVELINCAGQQVRSFSRLLAPSGSNHAQLGLALSQLGNEIETVFRITCTVQLSKGLPLLTPEQIGQLYRIAREAVRNAIQHACAELVEISVDIENESLMLRVKCDGKLWQRSESSKGIGLRIMHLRAERLGGKLFVQPEPQGGATVTCEIPLRELSHSLARL